VRPGHRLIAWGGGVFPTVVLAILLAFALPILPRLLEPGPRGGLRIEITGETWWWRVRYHAPDGGQLELANEIRLPVGERVELTLTSADVIHSFWIPSLGGKVDMIPGRVNRLALEPTRTGVFRGACAEFCGASHAYMNLVVVVTERDEFDRWLDSQRAPAATTSDPLALQGQAIFLANACRECHTVRGTRASATTGPDLTHVGSRLSLGADLLANDRAAFERWVEDAGAIKPSVRMPSFDFLTTGEIQALAAYLDGLL
jgi:cytochrome c oxidase subunit 2